jgi:hypothetical protein
MLALLGQQLFFFGNERRNNALTVDLSPVYINSREVYSGLIKNGEVGMVCQLRKGSLEIFCINGCKGVIEACVTLFLSLL